MVTKTLTVTENAYDAIKRLKQGDESFSDLFLRLGRRYVTIKEIAGILKDTPEEAAEFRNRMRQIREELGEGLNKRIDDVRARFQRSHRSD